MIRFEDVTFGYGDQPTVRGISFTAEPGEFIAIVGSNGAGKSTVSKLCSGLLKPSSGRVTILGQDTRTARASALARHVGFLFQNPDRQLCQPTVREEILFSLRCTMKDEAAIAERLEQALKDFDFEPDANPFSLSRGQRQRVALASLIAARPEVLILDEPTTGLDYRECIHMMELIRELNREQGITVLMVCHDMEVVLDFARRMLVMADGQLLGDGETREIFRDSALLEKASLLPPQIAQLAGRLPGPAFGDVYHVEEMVDAIRKEAVR